MGRLVSPNTQENVWDGVIGHKKVMIFLHALVNGVHTGFTQSAILNSYRLGTAANITRLKKVLVEKDLVKTTAPKHLEMSDLILILWLKKRVWRE